MEKYAFCQLTKSVSSNFVLLVDRNMVHALFDDGARCNSVVKVFAHGAMGRRIDPSW